MKRPFKKNTVLLLASLLAVCVFAAPCVSARDTFSGIEEKRLFARDVSSMLAGAWRTWQDGIVVGGVEVQGSTGRLHPGGLREAWFSSEEMMALFDGTGRSRTYIRSIETVAQSIEKGMRAWQKGYSHADLPFPQGASSSFTLAPCTNVPVLLASGTSIGSREMTESSLYGYMLYLFPGADDSVKVMFKISAGAVSAGFRRWERKCSIVGVEASGGIAPAPGPLGQGPGPVRGAKGGKGSLAGAYFDAEEMYRAMVGEIEKQKQR